MTEDIDEWRKYVHGVANPRINDGERKEQIHRFIMGVARDFIFGTQIEHSKSQLADEKSSQSGLHVQF